MKKRNVLTLRALRFALSLVGAFLLAVSVPVEAQQMNKISRIGFLGNSTPALEQNLVGPFLEGLRKLGYVDGKNLLIEYRWAEGKYERFPALIAELIAAKVNVIVTAGTPASLAVKKAAPTMPLVMIAVGDPVGAGLIESLAHPGGNVTGLTSIAAELEGKRLELLQEIVPKLSRVAVIWNPVSQFQVVAVKEAGIAAERLRLKLQRVGVKAAEEFDSAFASILKEQANALIVLADRLFLHNRDQIVGFATKNRLPAVYAYVELVEAGGLMSLGPSYSDMHRRAATYVDKILKGSKPANLPVEAPARFELIINLTAAQRIGLKVPEAVLFRADRIIK